MSGSKKQKQYRNALREMVKQGFGFSEQGNKQKLNDRGKLSLDRSLIAGYKLHAQLK